MFTSCIGQLIVASSQETHQFGEAIGRTLGMVIVAYHYAGSLFLRNISRLLAMAAISVIFSLLV
jgi:hypothetical protein